MSSSRGLEIGVVREEEFEEALELQGRVFQPPTDYFRTLALKDPFFEHENVFVAKQDGRIVSHVQVFPKLVRMAGAHVWMGGIGGVATDPDHRGKGLASSLLRLAATSMKHRGMEASILFTGIHDFYRRLGWETASGLDRYLVPTDRKPRGVNGCEPRRFTPDDLKQVMHIYDSQNSQRALSVVRSKEVWRLQLKYPRFPWPSEDHEGFTVVEKDGEVVAYARFGLASPWEGCVISEGGCLPGHEDALRACLGRLIERAQELGHSELSAVVPEDHPLASALARMGAERAHSDTSGMMLKVVDLRELLLRIEEGLSARTANKAIPRVKFELRTSDEAVSIAAAGGCVSIGQEEGLHDFYRVNDLGFAKIACGYTLPSELAKAGEAKCSGGALKAMDMMFPRQLPLMYPPDHF